LRNSAIIAAIIAAIGSFLIYVFSPVKPAEQPRISILESTAPMPVIEKPSTVEDVPSVAKEETLSEALPVEVSEKPAPEPLTPVTAVVSVPSPIRTVSDTVYRPHSSHSRISIPVLNYHGVTVQPGNRAVVTPAKLEEQMKYLSEHGYTTLSLKEFIDIWEGRTPPPEKPVLLTFDDGYKDNYTAAMPILKKYGFRATLFMSPGMVEDGYYLSWDEAKELQQNGWDIQPHGMTHPHLPKLSAEKQAYEIAESKRLLQEQLGVASEVFCYPYGERNATTLKLLKEHGFRYAFTIDQGRTEPGQDPLLLRRLFVDGEQDMNRFKALLHRK
jgi:peptidoglycan/xylan/chitin deacetylase (PgdA/CDA1 family)